ncbi:PR-1-like protein [Thelephora ganbajun]|uniref:PR-1-like protein n=1 Tax=Thelephora ganbajun TaxID=370292 RepID=A0ACB6ZY23_THEGA|nr:PR-1-like protein [Thelephora ganbajun]
MRARIVPPYPSFTYVMSQIGDSSQESQAGSQRHGNLSMKPAPRPYSKYDDNPFMLYEMVLVKFKTVCLFVAFVALPQVLAGPACARRHYGEPDCVEKCKAHWGYGGHYMGHNKWGSVISSSKRQDPDNIIYIACGLDKTVTSDPASTSTDSPSSSSSMPPPSVIGLIPTPSILNTETSSYSKSSSSTSTSSSTSSTSTTTSTPSSTSTPPPTTSSSSTSSPSKAPSPPNTLVESPSPVPSSTTSSVPSANPSPAGTLNKTGTNSITKESLTGHNSFRALHGASPLTWNDSLAAAAQSWVSGCKFEHSGGKVGPFGENLAAGSGGYTVTDAINGWTGEAKDYNPGNPVPSHFTQVVWKSTTEVGCAVITCPPGSIFDASYGNAQFIACEYSPPGNVIGEFGQNVQA